MLLVDELELEPEPAGVEVYLRIGDARRMLRIRHVKVKVYVPAAGRHGGEGAVGMTVRLVKPECGPWQDRRSAAARRIDVIEQHARRVDSQYLGVVAVKVSLTSVALPLNTQPVAEAAVGIALGDGRGYRLRIVDEVGEVSPAGATSRRNIS